MTEDEYCDTMKKDYDTEQGYLRMCRDAGSSREKTPDGIIIDTSGSIAPWSL